jgi:phosphatidylglycerophosphate synthase
MPRYSYAQVKAAAEPISNWSKFVVHPVSDRLLYLLANFYPLHPITLTVLGGALGLAAIPFYVRGDQFGFATGAALFYASFALDTIDGAMARLTARTSRTGDFLDKALDYLRTAGLAIALAAGIFAQTGQPEPLYLGAALATILTFHLFMSELSTRLSGARAGAHLRRSNSAYARLTERFGIWPNPVTLAELDALYLIVFPLLGEPLLGIEMALVLGTASRGAAAFFLVRRLRQIDADSASHGR